MKQVCFVLNNQFIQDNRVRREAICLANAGHQVAIIANAPEDPKKLPVQETIYEGVTVYRVLSKKFFTYSPYHPRLLKEIAKVVLRFRHFDVIHCHDAKTLLLGWILAKRYQAKLVYDSHEHWPSIFKENREKVEKQRKTLSPGEVNQRLKTLDHYAQLESRILPHCDAVISVADSICQLLEEAFPGKIRQSLTLRNICDYTAVQKEKLFHQAFQLPEDMHVLLYQGNIAEVRGISYLLDALEHLQNPKIAFVLMGTMGIEYSRSLMDRVSSTPILRQTVFVREAVPYDQLIRWTAAADLGICPVLNWTLTRYYCLPNKVFEYIQGELPMAVSNFPEMEKIINTYGVGFSFNPEDPQEIAAGIRKFFDSPELRSQYLHNIRQTKEDLHWENEQNRLVELYERL